MSNVSLIEREHSAEIETRLLYSEDLAERAYKLCARLGATQEDLATAFGVRPDTIKWWTREHPKFGEAVRKGVHDHCTDVVVKALVKSATGYGVVEETRERVANVAEDGTVSEEMQLTRTVTKHVPPNPTSIAFYLCNRDRDSWKSMNRVEITGEDGGPIQLDYTERSARVVALLDLARERRAGRPADGGPFLDAAPGTSDGGAPEQG